MTTSRWKEHQEELNSLRVEYDVAANHWRFLQGLRFIFLGITSTAYVGLFGAYVTVFNVPNINSWNRVLLIMIPVFGAIVSHLARLIEQLTERMITATTRRARIIEGVLKISKGIFAGAGVGLPVRRGQITVPDLIRAAFQILLWVWVTLTILSVVRVITLG